MFCLRIQGMILILPTYPIYYISVGVHSRLVLQLLLVFLINVGSILLLVDIGTDFQYFWSTSWAMLSVLTTDPFQGSMSNLPINAVFRQTPAVCYRNI